MKNSQAQEEVKKYYKAWILKMTKYVVQLAVHYRH